MRLGIIADIHANWHALEVALSTLQREGMDAYVCAGDLVGYGPLPNECARRVRDLGAVCVAGNHDLIALERLPDDQCIPLARESLAWTRAVLAPDVREYLSALPGSAAPAPGVRMAHGSLTDPRCYVTKPEQAEAQLAAVRELDPETRVLILGHTHRSWMFEQGCGARAISFGEAVPLPAGRPVLINPGSVGQSRDRSPQVRFALLDLDAAVVTFYSEPYDVRACRIALQRAGRPVNSCHLVPTLLQRCAGRVKRLARKALEPLQRA